MYKVCDDAFEAYAKYHGRNLDGKPMMLKITAAKQLEKSVVHVFLWTVLSIVLAPNRIVGFEQN